MKAFQYASVLGALLLTGGSALAQSDMDTQGNDSNISNPSMPSQDMPQSNTSSQHRDDLTGQGQGASGAQANPGDAAKSPEEASGTVSKVDSAGHKLTLTIPAGSTTTIEQTGHVTKMDRTRNMVTLQLPVARSAKVTRNGKSVKLSALKQGDDVRVSFDPSTKSLTSVDATPGSHQMPSSGAHDMGGHEMGSPDMNTPPSQGNEPQQNP